jgi:hypothetical protein
VLATVVAGIPILAHLLAAFGVYDLSPQQQQALSDALTWSGVLAAALIAGDTGLRASRNLAAAGGARHLPAPGGAEPGHADALPEVPEHPGPVPPDQGDAKTAVVA